MSKREVNYTQSKERKGGTVGPAIVESIWLTLQTRRRTLHPKLWNAPFETSGTPRSQPLVLNRPSYPPVKGCRKL